MNDYGLYVMVIWLGAFAAIGIIDCFYHVIPNLVVIPCMVIAIVFSWFDTNIDLYNHPFLPVNSLVSGLICAVVMGGIFAIAAKVEYGLMGMGDVKLIALIGLVLGFPLIVFAMLISSMVALITIWVLLRRGKTMKAMLPFGTFLCVGAIVALLLPDSLVRMVF